MLLVALLAGALSLAAGAPDAGQRPAAEQEGAAWSLPGAVEIEGEITRRRVRPAV